MEVAHKDHSGVGFVVGGGLEKITSQYIKTFNNKFRVGGALYKSEDFGSSFKYPKNVCYSEDDLSPRKYADKQYAVSSYFKEECVREDRISSLSRVILDTQRDKALVERALEITMEAIELEKLDRKVGDLKDQIQALNLNRIKEPQNSEFSEEKARNL